MAHMIAGVKISKKEVDTGLTEEQAYRRLAAAILLQWADDFCTAGKTNFCYAGWMCSEYFRMLVDAADIGVTAEEFAAKMMQERPSGVPAGRHSFDGWNGGTHYTCDFVDGYCVMIRDDFGHRFQPITYVQTANGPMKETPDIRLGGFNHRFWRWEMEVI